MPNDTPREADLFSIDPTTGKKTDAGIMDELLGDDDLDEGEYRHVIEDGATNLSYREKLRGHQETPDADKGD